MKGYVHSIEKAAQQNATFRTVLYTAKNCQLVVMSLKPGEDIGVEVHKLDQFFRVEEGEGKAVLDGIEHRIKAGFAILVPAGTLMATGLYWRGISNAAKVDIRHNRIESPNLPKAFDGFTIANGHDLSVEDAGDALAHRRAERARREADERAAYEKAADLESERPLPDLDATDAEMTREEQEGQQQQEVQYRICTQGRPQGSTTGRTSKAPGQTIAAPAKRGPAIRTMTPCSLPI